MVFFLLRWLVAALAGLSLAALFQWWGERLGDAVRGGPLGWLDRAGGLAMGAALGTVVVAFVLLVALVIRTPRAPGDAVARARVAGPLMGSGARACALAHRFIPGSDWLRQRFLAAERRATRPPSARVSAHS